MQQPSRTCNSERGEKQIVAVPQTGQGRARARVRSVSPRARARESGESGPASPLLLVVSGPPVPAPAPRRVPAPLCVLATELLSALTSFYCVHVF